MPELMDLVSQVLGGNATAHIGQQLGADPATTQSAISAALPMLLAGLHRNVSQPGGADALHAALGDHDGSALDDPTATLNASNPQGAGILRHVLGDAQPMAQQGIAQASGLGAGQAGTLLTMLAPLVMGAIGRQQRSLGLDANGIAGMLQ